MNLIETIKNNVTAQICAIGSFLLLIGIAMIPGSNFGLAFLITGAIVLIMAIAHYASGN